MKHSRDIEVEITFLPSEHGGRNGPTFSGYHRSIPPSSSSGYAGTCGRVRGSKNATRSAARTACHAACHAVFDGE
jgi:hypothetical protein